MVNDYVAKRPCPTRVYVNGTRIPASTVDVRLRKEGPLAINRYAEVNFASPWNDKDFLSLFNRFDQLTQEDVNSTAPNLDQLLEQTNTTSDRLRITCRDQKADQYGTLFHGIVTGVGDSSSSNRKIHHCQARGPEFFMENIPASTQYSNSVSSGDVTKYVVNELNKNLVLDISGGNSNTQIRDVESSDTLSSLKDLFDMPDPLVGNEIMFGTLDDLFSNKSFTANKHYLSDVINWLQDKLNARMWIQPTENGGVFTVSSDPTQIQQPHKAHYLDGGQTRVINNDALAKIRPLNTIIVKGGVRTTYENPGAYSVQARGKDEKFTKTKVRHKELYQRSNGKELSDTVTKSDAVTKTEVINEAKSILKKRIDGATGGTMSVIHERFIQPFNLITAKPTVNQQTKQTIDPITYEISRCHYKVRPNESVVPHIELNCGIKTTQDDLVVVNSWEKDA